MNYDLLWNMEEYQALLDYKFNSFKYINMFTSENITSRERKFNGKAKNYPQTPESFKKALETIINLYSAIKKNHILNDSKAYPQSLFRGIRNESSRSHFTSTSENIETAISFMSKSLLEIDSGNIPWIDLEQFIPDSKGGDLNEKEILFLPSAYQIEQKQDLKEYLNTSGIIGSLSKDAKRIVDGLSGATYQKAKLVEPNYNSYSYTSIESLVNRFDQYRDNLIKLAEATKNGTDTTEILEFKKLCSGYLRSEFNRIDEELANANSLTNENSIALDKGSSIKEVHIGNTGRMFSVISPNGEEKYYFKPAESKDHQVKPYRAYIQETGCDIQKIINPSRAVNCNVYNINGTLGAIQEKIDIDKDATRQFRRYFYDNVGTLSPKLLSQILDEYLVDYCLCNYDSHAKNFVIDKNGNLRGIDKEQSFRYIENDTNNDMLFSQNYNQEYGENETIYTTIFNTIKSGEISSKVLEGLNYRTARLAQIPDEKYRKIFKKYAYSKCKNSKEAEQLLDRIVARKKSITKKVDILKEEMYSESYGKGTGEYIFTDDNVVEEEKNLHRPYIRQSVIEKVKNTTLPPQTPLPNETPNFEEKYPYGKIGEKESQEHIIENNSNLEQSSKEPIKRPHIRKEIIEQFYEKEKNIRQNKNITMDSLLEEMQRLEMERLEKKKKKQLEEEMEEDMGMSM